MKKILHIIAQKPSYTGSGIYLQGICNEVAKKSYAQALVTGISQHDKINDFLLPADLDIYPVYFDSEEIPFPVVGMSDVMPYPSTKYSELTSGMYLLWKQNFTKKIEEALRRFKPDVIISHHLWLLTALVKELAADIVLIAISHGTELRQLELAPHFAADVIAACSQIEHAVVLNEFQAQKISSVYKIAKESILIGGVGFNPDAFYPPTEKAKNHRIKIIYAGKLSYAKGVKSLLNACALLYTEEANFELLLLGTGNGEEENQLIKLMDKSPFKVSALGLLSQVELGNIFRQGDIFVLPSFYEGLPLVVLEALASGLRVVVSDLPGLKSWLGENINNSGLISYVPLPQLFKMDQPVVEELPAFEKELKDGILTQINRLYSENSSTSPKIRQAINALSWAGVFGKIERLL